MIIASTSEVEMRENRRRMRFSERVEANMGLPESRQSRRKRSSSIYILRHLKFTSWSFFGI